MAKKTDFPYGANGEEQSPEWLVAQWRKAATTLAEEEAKLEEKRKEVEDLAKQVRKSELGKLFTTVAGPSEPPMRKKRKGGRPKGSKNKTTKGKAAKKTSSGRTKRGGLPARILAGIKKYGPISASALAEKIGTQSSSITTLKTSGKLEGVKEKDNPEDKRSKLLYL